jgi:hypothetical protein
MSTKSRFFFQRFLHPFGSIHLVDGWTRIRTNNDESGSGRPKNIAPDPDPQHWFLDSEQWFCLRLIFVHLPCQNQQSFKCCSVEGFLHHFLYCQAASKELLKKAESLDLDLKTKAGHYKRLKSLCKEEVKVYLQLLQTKKAAHGNSPDSFKKSKKKKKKKSESSAKEETVQAEDAPNKKIKFEDEESGGEEKEKSSFKSPDKKKLKKKKRKEKESANGGESSPEVKPKKSKKDDGPGAEKEINFAVKNFKIKQIKKKKKLAATMG